MIVIKCDLIGRHVINKMTKCDMLLIAVTK